MINFLKKPKENLVRVLPDLVMELVRKYFRVEIEGLENIPKRGAALICPNHSGYSGLDALVLSHMIHKETRRIPRLLAHKFWFLSKTTSIPAGMLGFMDASFENGVDALSRNNLIIIFPEGEFGNFKPTTKMYQLQEFKRGFIRMAVKTQSPIVPALIIGAEETHINLSQLKLNKFFKGAVIPLPLNIIPLPVKWKIKFLPPIYLPYKPEHLDDHELMREIASEIQEQMQDALSEEVQKRGNKFF